MRVIGLAGWSGAGKTTVLSRLIPLLSARGLSVSTMKHAHEGFDVDRPGKDSYIHREAGASEVLIASARRFVLMHELRGGAQPSLAELLVRMGSCDLVIIEGFKNAPHAKIEIHRKIAGKPFLFPQDARIVALASDERPAHCPLPHAALDDTPAILELVLSHAEPLGRTLERLGRLPAGRSKRRNGPTQQ
jgi:molybdopterin-guanine dinucleotide biosynthesis protein B